MLGDLIKLYEAASTAATENERAKKQREFDDAVETEICAMLTPSEASPKGQRKFDTISRRLGVFDDEPQELRDRLFRMGARRFNADDGTELWGFPPKPSASTVEHPKQVASIIPSTSGTFRIIYAIIGWIVAIFVGLAVAYVTTDWDPLRDCDNPSTIEDMFKCTQSD